MTKEIEIEGFGAFAEALEGIYNRPSIPETTGATAGDVLTMGSDGPEWAEVPKELPDATGSSAGDVLTLGSEGPEWATPSGGVSYSTTEQEVGTWTDGSKLYSRTYSKTLDSATSTTFSIAEIDTGITIRKADSTIEEAGYCYPGIYMDGSGSTVIMISNLENDHAIKARINNSVTWSVGTVFTVTIYYTKNAA